MSKLSNREITTLRAALILWEAALRQEENPAAQLKLVTPGVRAIAESAGTALTIPQIEALAAKIEAADWITTRRFADASVLVWQAVANSTHPRKLAIVAKGTGASIAIVTDPTAAPCILAAPTMLSLLWEAFEYQREQFDGGPDTDLSVDGGEMVDWFTQWRARVETTLAVASPTGEG